MPSLRFLFKHSLTRTGFLILASVQKTRIILVCLITVDFKYGFKKFFTRYKDVNSNDIFEFEPDKINIKPFHPKHKFKIQKGMSFSYDTNKLTLHFLVDFKGYIR